MKVRILLLIGLFITSIAFAQTQPGYVKALGRPEKKGEALSGVTIRVRGEHNPVVSDDDGTFFLLMTDKKNGDAYTLQQVQKNGYELNENDFIGRQFAFSDKVPLSIVMVSSEQLQADKQRIENNAYKTAEKNYNAKFNLLEKQLNDNQITAEQYREEIKDLQDKFEKYQSLIDGLAEHYAHTDYDELDEKDREINIHIENGDLERADSLIRLLFDPIGVLERNMEALADIERKMGQAQGIIDQANADMKAVLKQQEKDAEYLYQLYTIALARYDNEKAQFYIETRAALDTTNIKWQNEAGKFIHVIIADYNKASSYYQLALRHTLAQYGEQNNWTATLYNNIGSIYTEQGDYDKAIEYHSKAMTIMVAIWGENDLMVSHSYNNLGSAYYNQGDYDKALAYFRKALDIRKSFFGENHPDVAHGYCNIGAIYNKRGSYDKALEYFNKGLSIQKSVLKDCHHDIALSYNNIGSIYNNQGDYVHALEYYDKALVILKTMLGENHPDIAICHNNMGDTYSKQGNYNSALENFKKALTIQIIVFGENHPDVALSYNHIALVYSKQGNHDMALEYYKKALTIQKNIYGENHPRVAKTYDYISRIYHRQGKYDKVLECLTKCLTIKKSFLEENHPEVNTLQNAIVDVTYSYYEQALDKDAITKFNEDGCYSLTINDGETPASQQGMSGTYILLEFADWSQDSPTSLFDKIEELRGKPKDILAMKNGFITKHHFENIIGGQFNIKYVGKEERQRLNKAYEEWKKQNKNHP